MRHISHILVLFLTGLLSSCAEERVIAPDWTLATPEGKPVRLSDRLSERVRNQATVLFFWASWCPYCKALMPHLQSVRLEYGNDVEVLAINIMEDGDPVEFIAEAGYDFVLLLNGDEVANDYGIRGTPGVLVIDGDRGVRFDLRLLPPLPPAAGDEAPSHTRKAAYLAPYWAAEIRKSIDAIH